MSKRILADSALVSIFLLSFFIVTTSTIFAQGPVNGGFEGKVIEKGTGTPLPGAVVQFINNANGFQTAKRSDTNGNFRQDTLQPGIYKIVVTLDGYKVFEKIQELYATRTNALIPVPVELEKEKTAVVSNNNISNNPQPVITPTPFAVAAGQDERVSTDIDAGASLNPRRDEAFNAQQVSTLPLGGTTLTRSFDELALLAPGVAPPPQAIGNSVGPGVGGGVGTSGQFAVNGLRSRANNFTVDGSDNNDEDIGVRRQGFFALVPQPIESIQEFQIITLLAPAQYGRNLGAQVNALSKSGGNQFHGTLFGFFNASQLNARNPFDGASGNSTSNLTGIRPNGTVIPVFVDDQQKQVFNNSGDKDSSTFFQGGLVIGGPIVRDKMFFFFSAEGQFLNATQERHFVVPTVEQRGLFNSGATGLQQCQNFDAGRNICLENYVAGFPTSLGGDAVFSLFPFANDPNGLYGRNTYTQSLSADARGRILSGKYDYNFRLHDKPQTFTARYNYTDDKRDLTDVGGALFSAIRPIVRTDNFSTYLTSGLTNNVSNELRFSWGQTRLRFEEIKDTSGFLLPLNRTFNNPDDARFLLNAGFIQNFTIPPVCNSTGCAAPPRVDYRTRLNGLLFGTTAENSDLGPIGQLNIAGFSPVGVDVFNFPQQRVNNTFQIADTLRWQFNQHSFSFGTDIRRTYLNSNLPRNSRPLVTFNGGLNLTNPANGISFATPLDVASAGAATGFFQSLVLPGQDARIKLRYNQLDFFAQDEWKLSPRITLNLGLRYEFNTPPEEADGKIENTFSQSLPSGVAAFSNFIDGRDKIFDDDRNNFAPRLGLAVLASKSTVIRAGIGVYYDQILGAVVSQSRNVFPTFTTLNFGGGNLPANSGNFRLFNPLTTNLFNIPIVQPGTLNTLGVNQTALLNAILGVFPFFNFDANGNRIAGSAFGATLPQRELRTPFSYQYSVGIEQSLFQDTILSIGYVGTSGKNLLRFTTPNLGSNYVVGINALNLNGGQPLITGVTFDPTANPTNNLFAGRPVPLIGPISQFETTGESQYDSLQIELRDDYSKAGCNISFSYVLGKVEDNVSDVFDLAGAFALPQNSRTFAGEYAPANFDVRHRFTYSFNYDLPTLENQNNAVKYVFGSWQIAGTGKFNTGQPFTVNSIFDVNLDGNLTDRLNSTTSITVTGNRRQPLILAANANLSALLAPIGQDGTVPRNRFSGGKCF